MEDILILLGLAWYSTTPRLQNKKTHLSEVSNKKVARKDRKPTGVRGKNLEDDVAAAKRGNDYDLLDVDLEGEEPPFTGPEWYTKSKAYEVQQKYKYKNKSTRNRRIK